MLKHNWAWIKLATYNSSTVLTRNLRNPRDYAPLTSPSHLLFLYCSLATLSILLAEQWPVAFDDFSSLSSDSDLFWRFNAYMFITADEGL